MNQHTLLGSPLSGQIICTNGSHQLDQAEPANGHILMDLLKPYDVAGGLATGTTVVYGYHTTRPSDNGVLRFVRLPNSTNWKFVAPVDFQPEDSK